MITLSAADLAELMLSAANKAAKQDIPEWVQEASDFCRKVLEQDTRAVPLPPADEIVSMFEDEHFTYVADVGDVYAIAVIHSYHLAAIKYEDNVYYFWVLDPEDINVPEEEDSEEG